jgi:hypothetical protein
MPGLRQGWYRGKMLLYATYSAGGCGVGCLLFLGPNDVGICLFFWCEEIGEFAFWLRTSREKHACFDWVGWCLVSLCLVRSAVVEGEWMQYLIGVLTRSWSLTFV